MSRRPKEKHTTMRERVAGAIDSAIGVLSPAREFERARFRSATQTVREFSNRTSYRGASRERGAGHWVSSRKSADGDLLPELNSLRDHSRDLIRNTPIGSGVVETILANEIRDGIAPRSAIDPKAVGISPDEAKELQRLINLGFKTWAPHADIGGRMHFFDMQGLIERAIIADGDTLVVKRFKARRQSPFSLAYGIVESDRLATPSKRLASEIFPKLGDEIRSGVELGKDGEPIAYWIAKRHPHERGVHRLDQAFQRIPAYDRDGRKLVYHLYKLKRPGQTRGIPLLAPVIQFFQHIDEYMESELMAARVAACFSLFIKKNGDLGAIAAANAPDVDAVGNRLETLNPGTIEYLNEGEEPFAFEPNRPGSNFETFVETCVNFIGAGLGYPPQLIMSNWKGMNMAQMRGAMVQAGYMITASQKFLEREFCQPVFTDLVEEMALREDISVRNFDALKPEYARAVWMAPRREAIDPVKEAQAARIGIAGGFNTATEELARKGQTFEDHVRIVGDERALLEEAGLPMPEDDGADPASITKDAQVQNALEDAVDDAVEELTSA